MLSVLLLSSHCISVQPPLLLFLFLSCLYYHSVSNTHCSITASYKVFSLVLWTSVQFVAVWFIVSIWSNKDQRCSKKFERSTNVLLVYLVGTYPCFQKRWHGWSKQKPLMQWYPKMVHFLHKSTSALCTALVFGSVDTDEAGDHPQVRPTCVRTWKAKDTPLNFITQPHRDNIIS